MEIIHATKQFPSRIEEVAAVYRNAFSTTPWFYTWSQEYAKHLILEAMTHERFEAFLALGQSKEVVAAYWYYPLTIGQIAAEFTPDLASFVHQQIIQHNMSIVLYEKALFVEPGLQQRGVARQLRMFGFSQADKLFDQQRKILYLCRMREDNLRIITLSESMGFLPTGRTMPSLKEGTSHTFYYKLAS